MRGSVWLLPILLAGCTSPALIAARSDADVESVRQEARARIGEAAPPRSGAPDDGTIDGTVAEMLRGEIDEAAAVKIALLNNRRVREGYERLGIARADLVQAGLLDNPVLSADAKLFTGGNEFELGLTRSLIDLFLRPLRLRMAESALEEAQAEVARDLVALAFDVRRAFVDLRAAQRLVAARTKSLGAAVASHDLMRRLHAAGNVTAPKLTAEETSEARARIDLAAAEAEAVEAEEPLGVLLGLWGSATEWRIAGSLGDDVGSGLDLDRAESRAIGSSLDLVASRARIDAAARAARVEHWEAIFPDLEAGLVAKRESGGSEWGPGPGVQIGIPLLDAGHARRAKAAALLRQRLSHHVSLAVEIRSAARTYRERARSLRDRSVYLRETYLPLRGKLLRETLAEYNAMQVGAFEVLLARRDELDAEREYVETLRLAWRARLDLEELAAGCYRAPGGVAAPEPAVSGHEGSRKEH